MLQALSELQASPGLPVRPIPHVYTHTFLHSEASSLPLCGPECSSENELQKHQTRLCRRLETANYTVEKRELSRHQVGEQPEKT